VSNLKYPPFPPFFDIDLYFRLKPILYHGDSTITHCKARILCWLDYSLWYYWIVCDLSKQGYRTLKALLEEIDGNEADCFAKAVDPGNAYKLEIDKHGHFQAFFIAPAGVRYASEHLKQYLGSLASLSWSMTRYSLHKLL
jgi:hypothetical protein